MIADFMNMQDLRHKFLTFFKKSWPIWVIASLVVVFFWRVFLFGELPLPADFVVGTYYPWLDYKWGFEVGVPVKNAITSDVVSFTYPMQVFAIKLLKMGELPLWNPYILTGTPLLANFQSAPFAVNNILYFFTDILTGWTLKVVSQHFLAAVFTYLLLRHWKLDKLPSIFGSIIFAFGGFSSIWSQWNAHVLAASFIPIILLLIDKYLETRRLKYAVFLSFGLFLQITSGYPQVVFYTLVPTLLLWIFRFKKDKDFLLKSATLLFFGFLGIVLSSVQILPAWELLQGSQREIETLRYSDAFLPWNKLITLVAPDYYGNHSTQNYWGVANYTTTTGFVGVVALVLSGMVTSLARKKKEVLYALIIAFTGLLLAFPTPVSVFIKNSGIFGLQAASAHRALVIFNLGISILAAFGVQKLIKEKNINILKPLIFPGVLILVFGTYAALGYFYEVGPPFYTGNFAVREFLKVSLRNLFLPSFLFIATTALLLIGKYKKTLGKLVFIALLVLMTFELFRFGWKFNPFTSRHLAYPTVPTLDYLIEKDGVFRVSTSEDFPNMMMAYEIETLEGYDAIYPYEIAKYIGVLNADSVDATAQGRHANVNRFNSRLFDLANTKYIIALKRDSEGIPNENGVIDEEFLGERYDKVFEDKTTVVLENTEVLPRAFVVNDWEVERDRDETLRKLLNDTFPLRERIILENEPGIDKDTNSTETSVQYLEYKEQESTLLVKSSSDGLLFVSDLYYPGWKVYVDGDKKDILRANYAFRAVIVPEGEHEVQFIYEPESFKMGKWLSFATFIFLLGALVYDKKTKNG